MVDRRETLLDPLLLIWLLSPALRPLARPHPPATKCREAHWPRLEAALPLCTPNPPPSAPHPCSLPPRAGSLLLRTILSATLPNFLSLLAADYRRWAGIAGTGDSSARQLDAPVGELFSDAAAAVQEGRQRRQQQHGVEEPEQQEQQKQQQGEEPAAAVLEGQPAAAGEELPSAQVGQPAAAGEQAQRLR